MKNLYYDVVIAGCGVAGLYAALNLPEADSDMSLRQVLPSSLPSPSRSVPASGEALRRHTP